MVSGKSKAAKNRSNHKDTSEDSNPAADQRLLDNWEETSALPEETKATLRSFKEMTKISLKNKEALEELKSYGDILPKKRKGKSTKPTAKSATKIGGRKD